MKELIINEEILFSGENRSLDLKKISEYWKKIKRNLPENLKVEAEQKGFKLEIKEEDPIAKYFQIDIPNASKKLQSALESLMPVVICMKN